MNVLREYGLLVLVVVPLIAALSALWYYLLQFAYNDAVRLLIYFFMCLLGLASAAAVQYFVPGYAREEEMDKNRDDASKGAPQ